MVSRQTDKEATSVRVYKYGLVPLGYPPDEAIQELRKANNLWNNLVALHNENRELWEDARCSASIIYSELVDRRNAKDTEIGEAIKTWKIARQEEGTKDESTNKRLRSERAIIDRLKRDRDEIYEQLKLARKEASKNLNTKTLNEEYKRRLNSALRVENTEGLFNQTAGAVFDYFSTAVERARKDGGQLRFKRFDGTGFYNFRFRKSGLPDGLAFSELFEGNKKDARRFIITSRDDSHKKPRLRIRATLAGGRTNSSKVIQQFDLIYHRPIPDGAKVQSGKINRSRTGDKFRYDLVLTIKLPKTVPLSVPKDEAIGIDIGFRRTATSVQVATIISSNFNSRPEEIVAPEKMLRAIERVISIQSELDASATELGKEIKPFLLADPLSEDHNKYKLWSSAARLPSHVTLSFETAYKLARWLTWEPNALPVEAANRIIKWWRQYSRRYREQHNLRKKQLLNRKHFYRQIASDLVNRRRLIVLEDIDLSRFAETRDKSTKLTNKARAQRFLAAPSEFRDAIVNAADREGVPWVKVNPAYTSKICSDCGYLFKKLRAEKTWTCEECGVIHDRDENAAKNIANKALAYYEELSKKMVT
jgi:IS605 OrfB family transposase